MAKSPLNDVSYVSTTVSLINLEVNTVVEVMPMKKTSRLLRRNFPSQSLAFPLSHVYVSSRGAGEDRTAGRTFCFGNHPGLLSLVT